MNEHFQGIAFENRTSSTIQIDIRRVPLDFAGPSVNFTYAVDEVPIKPGESLEMGTSVRDYRSDGIKHKYVVIAVDQASELVFSKVFTWDELHDSGWRVVITAQP